MTFTGNKDTNLLILDKLNDKDLLNISLVNKYSNLLCQDENFWRNRLIKKYDNFDPNTIQLQNKTWREYYLSIIHYFNLGKNSNADRNNWNLGMRRAAQEGHMDIVEFFIDRGANNWEEGMYAATEGGYHDLVDFFISKGANDCNNGLFFAAKGGHRELVDFFISQGGINWNWGLFGSAIGGHRELVDFFISKDANYWEGGMMYATNGGHRDLVEFFRSKM